MSRKCLFAAIASFAVLAASCSPPTTIAATTTGATTATTTAAPAVSLPIQTGDETPEEMAALFVQMIVSVASERWQGEPDENLYIFEYRRYHAEAIPAAAGEPLESQTAIEAGWGVCRVAGESIGETAQDDDMEILGRALVELYEVPLEQALAITYAAAAALCAPPETEWVRAGFARLFEAYLDNQP